jgi:aspartate kinase
MASSLFLPTNVQQYAIISNCYVKVCIGSEAALSLIVMKFGGSSVGDAERMKRVAKRVIERKQDGYGCVVVVSAMGDTTDELIDLSKQIYDGTPPSREMDMLLTTGEQVSVALLSMAIHSLGEKAVSYTGWQSGIYTEPIHGKARITDIQPKRVLNAIEQGQIVIVAGFQGMSEDGEITTLGRGGSDTTAVALAAAIQADLCEIYTDVDGIYSTDPRVVKVARKLKEISYDEMLELANLGAAVLHPRAVEYAKNYNVALVVRSSFTYNEGTNVKEEAVMEQGIVVRGIAYDKNVARISILGVPEKPGQLAKVFTSLAKNQIDVDIIVQSGVIAGSADFSFTTNLSDRERALDVIEQIHGEVGYREVTSEVNLVKVSIVGAGMVSTPGVAATMFEVISDLGISISLVSTSEIKMSCVIDQTKLTEVIQALHTAFGLDTTEHAFVGGPSDRR